MRVDVFVHRQSFLSESGSGPAKHSLLSQATQCLLFVPPSVYPFTALREVLIVLGKCGNVILIKGNTYSLSGTLNVSSCMHPNHLPFVVFGIDRY